MSTKPADVVFGLFATPCLHSLIYTRGDGRIRDSYKPETAEVEGLQNCRESPNLSSVYIRLSQTQEKSFILVL